MVFTSVVSSPDPSFLCFTHQQGCAEAQGLFWCKIPAWEFVLMSPSHCRTFLFFPGRISELRGTPGQWCWVINNLMQTKSPTSMFS